MNPTALSLNAETCEITLPLGGTGSFIARIELKNEATVDPERSVMLFTISNGSDIASRSHRTVLLKKELPIRTDLDGIFVSVSFSNSDTRTLKPGRYAWDLTLVIDPDRDEHGEVIAQDDTDGVIPIFAKTGRLPSFVLSEVTYIV